MNTKLSHIGIMLVIIMLVIIGVISLGMVAQDAYNRNNQQQGIEKEPTTGTIYIRESVEFQRTLKRIKNGIVYCYSNKNKTTGFFVSADGWVLTAGHKVDRDFPETGKIYIKLSRVEESKIYESTEIIKPPEGWDLLLFKVDYKPKFYFKEFKVPHLFEKNWVVGFRGEADITVSNAGYISNYFKKRLLYYTTAAIYFGNSGSPTINAKGEILGIAVEAVTGVYDGLLVPGLVAEAYIRATLEKGKGKKKG